MLFRSEKILHNTYEQIILLLIRLAKNHGIRLSNDEVKLSTQFTNKDMANMIGSSRETVSRTLTQLKKKGFIQTAEDGHLILDIPLLKEELF